MAFIESQHRFAGDRDVASDLTACLCRGWCLLLLIAKTFQGFVKGHPKEKPLEIKCSRREVPLPFHYAGMRYCGLHVDGDASTWRGRCRQGGLDHHLLDQGGRKLLLL